MKLSNKTIKKFFKGAVCFEEERGYLTAYRYSKAQLDYMADPSYDWGWRMRAKFSGGIKMELKTDAQLLSFDYRASHMHERANTVDLYINGVLSQVYYIGEKLKGKVQFKMPQGEKLVAIYLPCESQLDIKNFTIDGGYKAVKDKGQKLLVIGDSITQGAGPQLTSAAYLHSLQRKTGYNILGQGVGGYRYEAKDLMTVDGFEPDKIIVFLGTNYYDEACRESCGYDYESAVYDFYKRLNELYPEAPIISVTPLFRTNDTDMARLKWCTETIKRACSAYENITVADGFDLMPNVEECLSDGVHPNAYGSELLATNLAEFMKEIKF